MNRNLYKSSAFRILPALLLAVFISAQIGLAGHLHANDSSLADCLQCQLDNGQAAISGNTLPTAQAKAGVNPKAAVIAVTTASIYALKARGPPALS